MSIRLKKYSYRYAEQIFNSKLDIKNEIENIIYDVTNNLSKLSRSTFNDLLRQEFMKKNWISQPQVFNNETKAYARFDFLKDRIGVEVQFGHPSFIGIDLLKFQVASYSNLDKIDFAVYITTTSNFQKHLIENYNLKWNGSLTFEKVVNYLPHIKSAIEIPIYVIGIDI